MAAKQWCWIEFNKDGKVLSATVLALKRDGFIRWNNCWNKGSWAYSFSETYQSWMFYIEFSAGNTKRKRKHVFAQQSDTVALLLPGSHPAYNVYPWEATSKVHCNAHQIIMQKIDLPKIDIPKDMPKKDSTGAGSDIPKNNSAELGDTLQSDSTDATAM